jgi:hypothetical protein
VPVKKMPGIISFGNNNNDDSPAVANVGNTNPGNKKSVAT